MSSATIVQSKHTPEAGMTYLPPGDAVATAWLNGAAENRKNLPDAAAEIVDCGVYAPRQDAEGEWHIVRVSTISKPRIWRSGFKGLQRAPVNGYDWRFLDGFFSLDAEEDGFQLSEGVLLSMINHFVQSESMTPRGMTLLARAFTVALAARSGALLEGREL